MSTKGRKHKALGTTQCWLRGNKLICDLPVELKQKKTKPRRARRRRRGK